MPTWDDCQLSNIKGVLCLYEGGFLRISGSKISTLDEIVGKMKLPQGGGRAGLNEPTDTPEIQLELLNTQNAYKIIELLKLHTLNHTLTISDGNTFTLKITRGTINTVETYINNNYTMIENTVKKEEMYYTLSEYTIEGFTLTIYNVNQNEIQIRLNSTLNMNLAKSQNIIINE